MISKLCVNTGSVSVGRRKWRPFIEFYLCIPESIVIYNTYIYINVHISLLKTRLMHILKFASQLVKPRCKRIVSIYLIYRITFYQLSWVFWKCKVLIVKLSFFSFQRAKKGHRNGVISWYRHFKLWNVSTNGRKATKYTWITLTSSTHWDVWKWNIN